MRRRGWVQRTSGTIESYERTVAMSERTWRPGEYVDSETTGDERGGGSIFRAFGGWNAEAWWMGRREMTDRGVPSADEAKRIASRWLDEREAEAQKGGTT